MRNGSVATVATVGFAVLCAAWLGGCNCGSTSGGPDGGPDDPLVEGGPDASVGPDGGALDAGADAGFDAGAVLVDAGADAGPAPVDGGIDAGAPGLAFVEVVKGGSPEPGIVIVFHDSQGAVKSTSTTDSSGLAWGTVVAGDQVTVVLGSPGEARLLTYVGVEPMDRLQVVAPILPQEVSIQVTSPPFGNTDVTVAAGNRECASEALAPAAVVRLTAECSKGPEFSVLETAFDATHTYFSSKMGIGIADAGSTKVSGLSSWRLGASHSLQVTQAPTVLNAVSSSALGQVSDGEMFLLGWKPITLQAGAGSAVFDFDSDFGQALVGLVEFRTTNAQGVATTSYAQLITGTAATQTLDLSAGVLPQLTSVSVGAGTPGRPSISWTAEASMSGVKGGVARLQWSGAAVRSNVWAFVVPPEREVVTAPELPVEFAGWAPGSVDFDDRAATGAVAALFQTNDVLAYRGFRSVASLTGLTRDPQEWVIWPWASSMRITSIAR